MIVENARRRATKAVMAKICPSPSPESRSAWISGRRRVWVLGDLPGPRRHGLLLAGQPGVAAIQNPRRQSGIRGCAQLPAPRQRAARVTEGRGGRGHQDPALAEAQTARRECLRHQLEQPPQGVWLVRPQPGHVPHIAALCEVFVVERLHLGGHWGSWRKLPVMLVVLLRVCGPGSPLR